MEYKYKYETIEERNLIMQQNSDKFLIGQENLIDGNYLVYTDKEPINDLTEMEMVQSKIATLETKQANTEYALMMGGLI